MLDCQPAAFPRENLPKHAVSNAVSAQLDRAKILALAPHMDDETLGCGGLIALHSDPGRVYCVFATDGSRSPAPLLPWLGKPDDNLPEKRKHEAIAALGELGVPDKNLVFLDLPDGKLSRHQGRLADRLSDTIQMLRPDIVLAPFRLDVHPDHVALNRAARSILRKTADPPHFLEYFVYFHMRLLPGGDIRRCLRTESVIRIDVSEVSQAKMRALRNYDTQIRVSHDWQDRPILTADRLRDRCSDPEIFIESDPNAPLLDVFPRHKLRIMCAFLAQRYGKRPKDQLAALLRWLRGIGKSR
jgi:LmbE family N-acetylglucosaminyl deacetylase